MWQDRLEADAGVQPMRSAPPTTDPDEGPPGSCMWHWSLLPEDGLLPEVSLPVQAALQGPARRWKDSPPSAVKHLLPFFPMMSQNQAAFESFILKAFLDFVLFFFFNDEIIRSVKKLRCCGWYRRKVTDSAENTANRGQLRRFSEAAEASPAGDCPLSFRQASFQPPRRQGPFITQTGLLISNPTSAGATTSSLET